VAHGANGGKWWQMWWSHWGGQAMAGSGGQPMALVKQWQWDAAAGVQQQWQRHAGMRQWLAAAIGVQQWLTVDGFSLSPLLSLIRTVACILSL